MSIADTDVLIQFIRTLLSSFILYTDSHTVEITRYFASPYNLCITRSDIPYVKDTDGLARYVFHLYDIACETVATPVTATETVLPDDLMDDKQQLLYMHIVSTVSNVFDEINASMRSKKNISSDACTRFVTLTDAVKMAFAHDKERILLTTSSNSISSSSGHPKRVDGKAFRPILSVKYHAKSALSAADSGSACTSTQYEHPYEYELQHLSYPKWQLNITSYVSTLGSSSIAGADHTNPCVYVDSDATLDDVLMQLSTVQEIGVCLQYHTYRSYLGYTCCMQIATRQQTYLIDVLMLQSKMHLFGNIFANPSIVKVFHRSDADILSLQRDFGLYIVNCFDICEAVTLLQFPMTTLSHIIHYYCGKSLTMFHALSDWRSRPLPEALLSYAKSRCEHLLYVYDHVRADLKRHHGSEGVEAVLNSSRKKCLMRYEYPCLKIFSNRGLFDSTTSTASDVVCSRLSTWRDAVARSMDESIVYVMTNSEMLRISKCMPVSMTELESCSPLSVIVRAKATDILTLVASCKTYPEDDVASTHADTSHHLSNLIAHVHKSVTETPSRKDRGSSVNNDCNNYSYSPISSPYSFQPANASDRLLSPESSSHIITPTKHHASASSPVMAADDIFRLAGWSTPGPSPLDLSVMESSVGINRAEHGFPSASTYMSGDITYDNGAATLSEGHRQSHGVTVTTAGTDECTSNLIPETYEEIYEISNRNRRRNKDSKGSSSSHGVYSDSVAHDGVTVLTKNTDASVDMGSAMFDECNYFSSFESATNRPADMSLDDTLNFAESMNWITDVFERKRITEEYQLSLTILND